MIELQLKSRRYPGLSVQIDDADKVELSQYRWLPKMSLDGTIDVYTLVQRGAAKETIFLGRYLLGAPPSDDSEVEFLDGNHLNCQRANLRWTTLGSGVPDLKTGRSSRFYGVTWNKTGKSWQVQAPWKGKQKYLGLFKVEEQAARAYDQFIVDHGIDYPLNFPDDAHKTLDLTSAPPPPISKLGHRG